ncbi:MAG: alcohol dehydrogenase catalytic domain-containing protein [Pseudoclavibacter sp.]
MDARERVPVEAVLLHSDLHLTAGPAWIGWDPETELLLEPIRVGICGSDLHVRATGDWVEHSPAILGHEVAARVLESNATGFRPGDLVVADSRIPCRACSGCRRSPRLCEQLRWLGEARPGGLATRLAMSPRAVEKVPAELPAGVAVLAEPLAVALAAIDPVLRAIDLENGCVLVCGFGPVGALWCAAGLRANGFRGTLVVAEPDSRRACFAERVGAAVQPSVLAATGHPDAVIEAAGYATALADALAAVVRGGIIASVALAHTPVTVQPADIVEKSIMITGSNGFEDHHLGDAVRLLVAAPDAFAWVVDETAMPLASLPDVWEPRRLLGAMKTTVRVGED